jgi:hypothetical protein
MSTSNKNRRSSSRSNGESLPSAFDEHDIVISDGENPYAALKGAKPGTYQLMDAVRGVIEDIEVLPDGSRRIVATQSGPKIDLFPGAQASAIPNQAGVFELKELRVGSLYADRMSWPEGSTMQIAPDGIVHIQCSNKPNPREMHAFHHGRVSVRLLTDTHTMLLTFRYGDASPWQEATYNVHRTMAVGGPEAGVCPRAPGQGYAWLVRSVMVDAATGRVVGLRQYALSNRFSMALLKAHEEQKAREADDAAHVRQVMRFQKKSTSALASMAVDRFEQGEDAN